jgi:hypothetical protein
VYDIDCYGGGIMKGSYMNPYDDGAVIRMGHYSRALAAEQQRLSSTRTEGTATSDGKLMVGGFNLNDPTDFAFFYAAKQISDENAARQKKK